MLDASVISDVDLTAAETLIELHDELDERGVELALGTFWRTCRICSPAPACSTASGGGSYSTPPMTRSTRSARAGG